MVKEAERVARRQRERQVDDPGTGFDFISWVTDAIPCKKGNISGGIEF